MTNYWVLNANECAAVYEAQYAVCQSPIVHLLHISPDLTCCGERRRQAQFCCCGQMLHNISLCMHVHGQ